MRLRDGFSWKPSSLQKGETKGSGANTYEKSKVTLERQNVYRLGGSGMAVYRVKHLGRPCVYAVCLQVLWEEWSIRIIALRE